VPYLTKQNWVLIIFSSAVIVRPLLAPMPSGTVTVIRGQPSKRTFGASASIQRYIIERPQNIQGINLVAHDIRNHLPSPWGGYAHQSLIGNAGEPMIRQRN
jgi:hypothetical protein